MQITALVLLIVFIAWLAYNWKNKNIEIPLTVEFRSLLNKEVQYYKNLIAADKVIFEQRMQQFLSGIKITGIGTTVEETDRVLIAASAIIPIFAFSNWQYNNLHEVLLYPQSFNEQFKIDEGQDTPVIGMVGSGGMKQVMILSKPALRAGFSNKTDKNNTGIHEFVHLIDMTDGEVDGLPQNLLDKQYALPWMNLVHENIKEILADKSDINLYGATNKAEFFAVVSEYFFKRPDLLQSKHPQLYQLLEQIFKQDPAGKASLSIS